MTKVWNVASTTNAILELADQLAAQRVERVVVESTSDYWRAVLLPARSPRATRLARERPGREERARPAQDRQGSTRCGWPS